MKKFLLLPLAAALAALSCNTSFAAVLASDNAANSAYSGGWTNTSNGGTGFGGWTFGGNAVSGTTAKIASSTLNGPGSIDGSGSSFQLLDNGAAYVDVFRYLVGDLAVGQTFSLDMKVNFRAGFKGINIRGADDTTSIFKFETGNPGTGDDYIVYNTTTGNGSIGNAYSNNTVFNIALTQTSAGGGSWAINRTGGVLSSSSGTYTGAVSSFQLFSTGSTSISSPENTIFYNNFAVVPEPTTIGLLLGGAGLLAFVRRRRS